MNIHNLQGNQFHELTMFEPAGKLADPSQTYHNDAWRSGGASADMVRRKVDYSKRADAEDTDLEVSETGGESLYDSIGRRGVADPVAMFVGRGASADTRGKPVLRNGHHRVFAAADQNPSAEVPVKWEGG